MTHNLKEEPQQKQEKVNSHLVDTLLFCSKYPPTRLKIVDYLPIPTYRRLLLLVLHVTLTNQGA